MNSVLIIGKHGQVSTYLQRQLVGDFKVNTADRKQLDLSKIKDIYATLAKLKPTLIVNPAAYTAVDLAEQETEQAFLINRDAVAEIARYCADHNTPLIHYSTDYVFAGDSQQAYRETDEIGPTGVYGQSKLEGENAIIDSGAPAIILRTAWVYSNHGKNFYKTMLALSETRDQLSVVSDQIGAPTYAGSIAGATNELIEKILSQGHLSPEQFGVYHFSCQGQTSWYHFVKAIYAEHSIEHVTVSPVGTEDYPTPAKRPAFSVLDNQKLQEVFGLSLPQWSAALKECVRETKQVETSASGQ